jgi:hypothetical protein
MRSWNLSLTLSSDKESALDRDIVRSTLPPYPF